MLTEKQLKTYNLSSLIKVAKSWMSATLTPAQVEMVPILATLIRSKGGTMPPDLAEAGKVNVNTSTLANAKVSDKIREDLLVSKRFINSYLSAEKRGIEWELTLADVRRLMRRKICVYTGLAFEDTDKLRMTLERVDNKKGYTKENVVPVCFFANQLKAEMVENITGKYYMEGDVASKFIKNALAKYL